MSFYFQSQALPAGSQYIAKSFNVAEPPAVHAATILSFLQGSLGTAKYAWLTPVIRFARQFPAFSGNILEVHFGKNVNQVDFATRLNASFDGAVIEGLQRQSYQLPFVNNRLATLIKPGADEFVQGIENIWVEFDAPFKETAALFFDIGRDADFSAQHAYEKLQQVADGFQFELNGRLPRFLEQVEQLNLHVVYYGFMFSRNSRSVRMTINGIKPEYLSATLDQLGWKGNYDTLEKFTAIYLKKGQKLVVGVDIGDKIEDRTGIEIFDDNKTNLIQTLYNNRHIDQTYYEFLNTWEQIYTLPADLSSTLTSVFRRPVSKLYTRLNHFKFVLDATGHIASKGYLYYCF